VPDVFKGGEKMYFIDKRLLSPVVVLDSKELKEVFDELVPVETRKGKGDSYRNCSGFGPNCSIRFEFENVHITNNVYWSENAVIPRIGGNLDLFFGPPFGAIESTEIVWAERTCIQN
jgi:hypothetical protein